MNSRSQFIVAELSANHLGSLDRALALVDAAAVAGADAVKLQTFSPESMVADPTYVITDGPWAGRLLIDLYREAQTPREWHGPIFERARALHLVAFSTPFSPDDADFLETLSCPLYKIASFELVDLPLIRHVAAKGRPMILSSGMATLAEGEEAVRAAVGAGCRDLTVLKCTSAYPAPPAVANLATMEDMRARFGCKVGLSDHTLGIAVPVAAAVLGADMIEKHLTLRRADGGPDAAFSLEPHEFAQMVEACRAAAAAIGEPAYGPTPAEAPQLLLRRSLWWAGDHPAGDIAASIRTARPATGLHPRELDHTIGRRLTRDVRAGDPVLDTDFT